MAVGRVGRRVASGWSGGRVGNASNQSSRGDVSPSIRPQGAMHGGSVKSPTAAATVSVKAVALRNGGSRLFRTGEAVRRGGVAGKAWKSAEPDVAIVVPEVDGRRSACRNLH